MTYNCLKKLASSNIKKLRNNKDQLKCKYAKNKINKKKTKKRLTYKRKNTKHKNNYKIFSSNKNCSFWCRILTIATSPTRGTDTLKVMSVTQVFTFSPVLTKARIFTLIFINTLGCSQSSLAFWTTKNKNKTEVP